MSNYWPVVMWLSETDKTGDVLIYRPSFSHYSNGYKHKPRPTYELALWDASRHIAADTPPASAMQLVKATDALPTFMARVVCQPHTPIVDQRTSKIRSYVRRIRLGENLDDDNGYSNE